MADSVKATWVAPFVGELPDGTQLIPNETVVEIPAGEAEASDHWRAAGSGSSRGPTVANLKEKAAELGLTVPKGTKKKQLEKLIADAQATPTEPEAPVSPAVGQAEAAEAAGEGESQESDD